MMQTAYIHSHIHPFTEEHVMFNKCALCSKQLPLDNQYPMMIKPLDKTEEGPLIDCTGDTPTKIANSIQILKPVCWACAGIREFDSTDDLNQAIRNHTLEYGIHDIVINKTLVNIRIGSRSTDDNPQ